MQIFIPATIFQCKVSKNSFNDIYRTLHITKEYVAITDTKTIVKVYCNNSQLEYEVLNLDFCELKNFIKAGSKKSGEISIHANVKEYEAEITYKSNKGIMKGIVKRYMKFPSISEFYNNANFTYKVKLSSAFSKLALFDNFAKKIIEFKDNLITARIGNARIAKQGDNIENSEINGLKIALSLSDISMVTLDTKKEATWYFKSDTTPYRITQHDLENTIDIISMPTIM